MSERDADDRLRAEFNQWAAAGRGEEMEQHHASITAQTLERMALRRGERVLDLGCGAGWATLLMARAVAGDGGHAVGLDISDEMIARARDAAGDLENVMFVHAAADELPWQDEYFDKVLSVESFYYYPDQEAVLRELLRVIAPGGQVFILVNLYKENPYSLRWVDELKVKVHVRSEAEYLEMLGRCGFVEAEAGRIPDLTPTPEIYSGKWFKDAAELREFKRIGALLLRARRAAD